MAQRIRVLPVLRRYFHDHMVLVERVVDGGDLPLPKGIVKHGIHLLLGQTQAGHGVAIENQQGLQPFHLLVGVDIGQHRQGHQSLLHLGRPCLQLVEVLPLQGVLVLSAGRTSPDADILHRLQKKGGARFPGKRFPEPGNHLVGAVLAFRQRFEADEHISVVPLSTAGKAHGLVDRRILADHINEVLEFLLHGLKGDALIGADGAGEAPGILLREETFGDNDI